MSLDHATLLLDAIDGDLPDADLLDYASAVAGIVDEGPGDQLRLFARASLEHAALVREILQFAGIGQSLRYDRDPDDALRHAGWTRGTSKAGKTKWTSDSTGETRYQEQEPGSRKTATPKEAPQPRQPLNRAQEVSGLLQGLNAADITPEHVNAVTDGLLALSHGEILTLGHSLGLQPRGLRSKVKGHLARALIAHVTGKEAAHPERLALEDAAAKVKAFREKGEGDPREIIDTLVGMDINQLRQLRQMMGGVLGGRSREQVAEGLALREEHPGKEVPLPEGVKKEAPATEPAGPSSPPEEAEGAEGVADSAAVVEALSRAELVIKDASNHVAWLHQLHKPMEEVKSLLGTATVAAERGNPEEAAAAHAEVFGALNVAMNSVRGSMRSPHYSAEEADALKYVVGALNNVVKANAAAMSAHNDEYQPRGKKEQPPARENVEKSVTDYLKADPEATAGELAHHVGQLMKDRGQAISHEGALEYVNGLAKQGKIKLPDEGAAPQPAPVAPKSARVVSYNDTFEQQPDGSWKNLSRPGQVLTPERMEVRRRGGNVEPATAGEVKPSPAPTSAKPAAPRPAPAPASAGPAVPDTLAVERDIFQINKPDKYGITPSIPDIYDQLKQAHPQLTEPAFHDLLRDMQKRDLLTLQSGGNTGIEQLESTTGHKRERFPPHPRGGVATTIATRPPTSPAVPKEAPKPPAPAAADARMEAIAGALAAQEGTPVGRKHRSAAQAIGAPGFVPTAAAHKQALAAAEKPAATQPPAAVPEVPAKATAAAPAPEAKSAAKKEPWEMTVNEYESQSRLPTFGDVVRTKDGTVGIMRGSGGMGSGRVGVEDTKGNRAWHNRDDLSFVRDPKNDNRHTQSADEWLADVKHRVDKLRQDNQGLLLNKSITDRFRKELASGGIDQALYEAKVKSGVILDDAKYAAAVAIEKQIKDAQETPLKIKDNAVHRSLVETALKSGKSVPPAVLADYPDLQAKYGGKAAAKPQVAPGATTAQQPQKATAAPAQPAAMPAPQPRNAGATTAPRSISKDEAKALAGQWGPHGNTEGERSLGARIGELADHLAGNVSAPIHPTTWRQAAGSYGLAEADPAKGDYRDAGTKERYEQALSILRTSYEQSPENVRKQIEASPGFQRIKDKLGLAAPPTTPSPVVTAAGTRQRPGGTQSNEATAQAEREANLWDATREAYQQLEREMQTLPDKPMPKIPRLVDLIRQKHPEITDAQMHQLLQKWQKEDRLTLQSANDPHMEPTSGRFIQGDRGPLGYIDIQPHQMRPQAPGKPPASPASSAAPLAAQTTRPQAPAPTPDRKNGGDFVKDSSGHEHKDAGPGGGQFTGKGGEGPAPAASSEPEEQSSSPFAGHPLLGMSPAQMKQALGATTMMQQRAAGKTADLNPWKIQPSGSTEVLNTILDNVIAAKKKNSFGQPMMKQVYEAARAAHPTLTVRQFQSAMDRLTKDGKLIAGGHTQNIGSLPDDQVPYVYPMDGEVKLYADLGAKYDPQRPPARYQRSGRAWQFARLAERAMSEGDSASARIYARQAEEATT
jgi:hypothetical protein